MAKKFHLNRETGEVNICKAFIGRCRFGADNHSERPENLQKLFEATMRKESFGGLNKNESNSRNFFLNKIYKGKELEHYYETAIDTIKLDSLNVAFNKNSGELVGNNYFSSRTIIGTPDYNRLTKDSYKDFGFIEIDENNYHRSRKFKLDRSSIVKLSQLELSNLSEDERKVLSFYTSSGYFWFNRAIHSKGKSLPDNTRDNKMDDPFIVNSKADFTEILQHDSKYRNTKTVEELAEKLDSALDKSPKIPRILYKGVRPSSEIYKDYSSTSAWIDGNSSLGQEILFDGYQSTSLNNEIAETFAYESDYDSHGGDDTGIIYEIMTPEGLNISSVSSFRHESEVILPRSSRFLVVGVHKDTEVNTEFSTKAHVIQLVAINSFGELLTGDNGDFKDTPISKKYFRKQIQ